MIPPTVTVSVRKAALRGQERAARLSRTQQLELGEDLFMRIAPGGRKFLLFCLDAEPPRDVAEELARVLGLRAPVFGWHQGATLRSLTVVEEGADHPGDENSDDAGSSAP